MGKSIETTSPLVQMCPGWGLNLTAQRRQRTQRCRLLRVATPFMALGGRFLPWAVAARSPGLLTAIPWLAPRWFEWPDRDISSAQAEESSMSSLQATIPAVTFPSAHIHPQRQAQLPIAFSVALQSAGWSNFPALVSPFSEEMRAPALSSPTPKEATVHLEHTRRENANMGMGSAFPQPRVRSQISQTDDLSAPEAKVTGKQIVLGAGIVAGPPLVSVRPYGPMMSRLPSMAPSWGPLGSFIGLTPGIFPAAFYRVMTSAAPGHRAKQAVPLHQNSPDKAVDNPEMPPLPEHKQHGGRETVAPGPVPLQGLGLVMEVISRTMKREVAAAIKEREKEAQSLAPSRSNGFGMTTEEDMVSDNLVRLYMQKMRKLSEEERFRLGLLR